MADERLASSVVTSDNYAEFAAQRLGLGDPAPESEAAPEAEPQAQVESNEPAEPEEAKPTEEKKPNPRLEKRFSEITKQREQARAEAQREREAREALEARLKELEAKVAPPAKTDDLGQEPKPDQFTDAFEYAKALAEWTAEKKLQERDKQEAERKAAVEREQFVKTWADRVQQTMKEIPDYEEMIASSDVEVSNPVRDAIMESDVGPKILYHLAENPEIAARWKNLSLTAALREVGKLEAQLERKPEQQKAAVVERTKAPDPITPIRATTIKADIPMGADGEFRGTYQEWKEARRAKKIR